MSWSFSSRSVPALVCGALVASVLLLAPAAEAKPTVRTISVSASPDAALGGAKVTFSGKLSKSPKGTAVKIQRKVGAKWVQAKATLTKSGAGAYSVKVTLPAKAGVYRYRAFAPAFEGLKAAVSKAISVTSLRKTRFYFGPIYPMVSPGVPIADGSDMKVVGSLKAPCTGGGKAHLQKKVGSAWTTVASATVAGPVGGSCAMQITQHNAHGGTYRVLVDRRGLNASVASPATAFETKL